MKNVIVIGASSGYGLGIAEKLQQDGYKILTGSRTPSRAGYFVSVDVTEQSDIDVFAADAVEYFSGRVDAVIYSAGIAIDKKMLHTGRAINWERVFKVNTLGLMRIAKAFLPHLMNTKGHLIHIGSIASFTNYPGGADYCASKAASTSIMKTLRLELLGTGIKTCSIEPGLGDTNFQYNRYNGDKEKAEMHYAGIKQLEPADLGNAVSWVLQQPPHVNIDEIIIKPIEQANHGILATDKIKF